MRKLLVVSSLILFSSLFGGVSVQINAGDPYYDNYYDDTWYGPGWYYGVYFGDEPAYWGWRGRYPRYRNYYNSRGYGGGRWDNGHWHGNKHHKSNHHGKKHGKKHH